MKIDIKEILKQMGSKKKYSEKISVVFEEIGETTDIDVDVEFTNAQSRIILKGRLIAGIHLVCSRCLEKYLNQVNVSVYEEFLPEGSPEIKEDSELSPGELSVFIYSGDEIDLGEIIRQNIISALPMQPLCAPDCSGLCGNCGENLNSNKCGCNVEKVDPRLTPLLKFKGNN